MINVHELKFEEKDEFSKRFNVVSDLYRKAMETDAKEDWDEFFQVKYCLEQGLPIALLNDEIK